MIRINVYFLLLFHFFEIISSDISINCHYETDGIDINPNDMIYCSSKVIDEIIRDKNSTGRAAPKARWVQAGWFLDENKIGLNLSWKQNALKVKEFVTGYTIEIKSMNGLHHTYLFNITINKWRDVNKDEEILFNFVNQVSEQRSFPLIPGSPYTALIDSLPNYNEINFPEKIRFTIPNCCSEDDLFRHAEICSESECRQPKIEDYPNYKDIDYPIKAVLSVDKKEFGIIIFIAVALIVFCAISIMSLYLMKTRKMHERRQCKDAETLVITSTSNTAGRPAHWDFTSKLAYQIQETDSIKTSNNSVKCNLWEMNESISDPDSWFCKKVVNKSCKQIILIEANCRSTNDVVAAAIKWLTHGKLNSVLLRVFILYFGDCYPDYVKNIKSNVSVECYQLPKDLKTILNKINVIKGSKSDKLDQMKKLADKVQTCLSVV